MMLSFELTIVYLSSTDKRFQFSYKCFHFKSTKFLVCHQEFQTIQKDFQFKTKAAIKNQLLLLCSIIITGYLTQIYANRLNSLLVIQTSSDPRRNQMHGTTLL